MVEIKIEGGGSGEESEISEANHMCARTPTHPSLPSISSSNMMSYIKDKTPGDRDMENGDCKGLRYIYIPHPTTTIITKWGRDIKVE